jgi:hypothetical protein
MNPVAFNASLHAWEFFVTLTYESRDKHGNLLNVPNELERRKMLFAFLREVAKGNKRNKEGTRIESVTLRHLLFLAREERGEVRGRYHWHILISGLPSSRINVTECHVWKHIWKGLRGGHSDVRLFETGLSGVSYVMKGLDEWSRVNANAYELSKFSESQRDRMLILSDSCFLQWGQLATSTRASDNSSSAVIAGMRPSVRRNPKANRKNTKEAAEAELRAGYGYSMHPAGVSFVV